MNISLLGPQRCKNLCSSRIIKHTKSSRKKPLVPKNWMFYSLQLHGFLSSTSTRILCYDQAFARGWLHQLCLGLGFWGFWWVLGWLDVMTLDFQYGGNSVYDRIWFDIFIDRIGMAYIYIHTHVHVYNLYTYIFCNVCNYNWVFFNLDRPRRPHLKSETTCLLDVHRRMSYTTGR